LLFLVSAAAAVAATATTAATATAAAVAAATTPTATPSTATAAFLRTGFVHGESTAILHLPIQAFNGSLSFLVRFHFDETESFGATGIAIHDYLSRTNAAKRSEHRFQVSVGYLVSQVADIQSLTHNKLQNLNRSISSSEGRLQSNQDLKNTIRFPIVEIKSQQGNQTVCAVYDIREEKSMANLSTLGNEPNRLDSV
jgi:hypothetical protein